MMNLRILAVFGSVAAVAGLVIAPTAVHAQSAQSSAPATEASPGGLEEVMVTAQRREEKAVDVPITIAAIDAQQLVTANVQNLSDIAQLTPSLRFDYQTGFYQPSVRGIGTAVTTSGGGSNVGIYIDGFYSPNPVAADFQLLDVTGVQVLKGPQGTLFGHNTTGGAILVTTADPSTTTRAEAKVSYGSFNAQKVQGYATTGLSDNVAADIEGVFSKGNGFITNIINHDTGIGAYENATVRAGLKVNFTDKLSVLLRYTHTRENDPSAELTNSNVDQSINPTTGKPWGVQTLAIPGLYTTNPDQVAEALPVWIRSNNDIAQMTVKADLGFADLTSYSQWRQEDTSQVENLGQVGITTFQLGLPIFDSTYTQEFLLASKPGTRLQWTTGAFLMSTRDEYVVNIDNNLLTIGPIPYGGSQTTTQTGAVYFDGTYELMPDKLYFTAGVRGSHDIVEDPYWNTSFVRQRVYVPSINSNKVTPRAVLRYKPTDQSSVYASFSEGYKAAIIDVGGSCQDPPAFQCNPIRPEDVYAYEVGYKFESRNFSNEAAVFDYQYKNLQVSEFLGNALAYIVNAAQSRIYGLEDEFHFNYDDHIQVNGGISWTHARYTTFGTTVLGQVVGAPVYQTCPGGLAVSGCYASVNTSTILQNVHMQHVPDYTANIGPRYTTGMTNTGEYSVSANAYYSSGLYMSPSGTQFYQPSYTTLAMRGEWKTPSGKYTVALYGDNVTDVRYRTQVQYNGFGIGASWNAPATWGIEFGAKL